MARRRRHPARRPTAGPLRYVYPFYPSATTGRIDQGQDFGGTGPVLAIGKARVVKLGAPGWPGGQGILYQLLEGPYRGRHVFVYEGVSPSVRVGQTVEAGQVIGRLIPGSSTGIETGWADANGVPLSHGEYTEGKETAAGKSFAAFLAGLKGKGGGFPDPLYPGETAAQRKQIEQIAGEEGLKSGLSSVVPGANLPEEVINGIVGALGSHAEALMLNIALLFGGAFLVYYGAALMLGIRKPVAGPAKAAAKAGAMAGTAA